MRVGLGVDVHRFGGDPPLLLGGVTVDERRGLEGTSDADVLAHAVTDAVLGAAALGDMGDHFPSSDPRWAGADSMEMLASAVAMAAGAGLCLVSLDVTVVAERVRVAPHRAAIRSRLGAVAGIPVSAVSVKATSTDGLGFLGDDRGVAALAVAVLREG